MIQEIIREEMRRAGREVPEKPMAPDHRERRILRERLTSSTTSLLTHLRSVDVERVPEACLDVISAVLELSTAFGIELEPFFEDRLRLLQSGEPLPPRTKNILMEQGYERPSLPPSHGERLSELRQKLASDLAKKSKKDHQRG